MRRLIFISGACGCGKTTFTDAYAKYIAHQSGKTVYVIHGDTFHNSFVEPEARYGFPVNSSPSQRYAWKEILQFNWDCIIDTAGKALRQGMDVIVDYVIEDELLRARNLAEAHQARLYYIVLTADACEIERRIRVRGDSKLIERALFLKEKLEAMPENRGHLYDNTDKHPEEMIREIELDRYRIE